MAHSINSVLLDFPKLEKYLKIVPVLKCSTDSRGGGGWGGGRAGLFFYVILLIFYIKKLLTFVAFWVFYLINMIFSF